MTYIIIIFFICFRESSLPEGTTSILWGYVLLEIGEPANCLDAERECNFLQRGKWRDRSI